MVEKTVIEGWRSVVPQVRDEFSRRSAAAAASPTRRQHEHMKVGHGGERARALVVRAPMISSLVF